ncbi:MAG: hypothetical protein WEC33_08215 [Dehalococcoidia bacterium]
MLASYTIDVENQVILNPGGPSQRNLTAAGLECSACALRYPDCGSRRPGSNCPVFIASPELEFTDSRRSTALTI